MQDGFLHRLSQPGPDPGGGAAAAHGGLLALSIMEKVSQLDAARPMPDDRRAAWDELLRHIRGLKKEVRLLRERDCSAYMKLAQARAAGAGGSGLAQAWEEAILCPMAIMEASVAALKALSELGGVCGKHLVADLQVAAEFLAAVFRGAGHIARTNVRLLARDGIEDRYTERLSALSMHAEDRLRKVLQQLLERLEPPDFRSTDR
jgi:formiminotetrahydrofolate cyclodeaminase